MFYLTILICTKKEQKENSKPEKYCILKTKKSTGEKDEHLL